RRLLEGGRIGAAQLLILLLFIHLRIRDSKQLVQRRLVNHRHVGNPDTEGKAESPGRESVDEIRSLLQSLTDLLSGVLCRVGHQNTEFIAPYARKNVRLPKASPQNVGG